MTVHFGLGLNMFVRGETIQHWQHTCRILSVLKDWKWGVERQEERTMDW